MNDRPGVGSGPASDADPANFAGRPTPPVTTSAAKPPPPPVRDGAAAPSRARHGRSFLGELPILLLIALGLALLLKAFVVQAFYIPSGSMEPTLEVGDRVLVNKLVYRFRDIERGEVVVFNGLDSWTSEIDVEEPTNALARGAAAIASAIGFGPPSERDFIKRVIGLPGDRVVCCDAKRRITVNGVAVEESAYLFSGNRPSETPFDIEVPTGRIFVLGDHRAKSSDSRAHLDVASGTIPTDKVIGRAFVIVWPVDRFGGLGVPATFESAPLGLPLPIPAVPAAALAGGAVLVARRRDARRPDARRRDARRCDAPRPVGRRRAVHPASSRSSARSRWRHG